MTAEEADEIALIAPRATINVVRDYEIFKKHRVALPDIIHGIVKCINPRCITNSREPVEPKFKVLSKEPLRLRCSYCETIISREDVMKQF